MEEIVYEAWEMQRDYWKQKLENTEIEYKGLDAQRDYWKQKLENAEVENEILMLRLKKTQCF